MIEIRAADPAVRRKALRILLIGLICGALAILALAHYREALEAWLTAKDGALPQRLRLIVAGFAAVAVLPSVAFSVYLWSLGARTIRAGIFPPRDLPVTRDTRVVAGGAAIARGRALQMLAVAVTIVPLMMTYVLWRLVATLTVTRSP